MEFNSPIPYECYDEIFYQIRNDRKTLHSCLFVNRFFCHHAASALWGAPFEHVDLKSEKLTLIMNIYVRSLVDEDKSYLRLVGIPVKSRDTLPYFCYPEFLKIFNSQIFDLSIENWLKSIDPNYYLNYENKIVYASYIISDLLLVSAKKLKSLKSRNGLYFVKSKEFPYSISHLVNLEITYFVEGDDSKSHQSDEDKLNNLFDALTCYTFTIKFAKINISSDVPSFTTRIIKGISNFIAHQYNLESLSFNETLISENLFEFEKIIKSQKANLKCLTIGGKLKNFARIIKVLRDCINLESLTFKGDENSNIEDRIIRDRIIEEDSIMIYVDDWGCCDIKMRETPIFEEFEFNQLKIENLYCVEDNDEQQEEDFEITIGDDLSISNDIVALSLEKILLMTNIHLRTLNLDLWSFIKLMETLRGLEHLKLKLELSSIDDDCIVALANSLPDSLQKLGLNICSEDDRFITHFLTKLFENMNCNNLFELCFYNNQMIRNDNLGLVIQYVLNRIRYFNFKYVIENFNEDFDQFLLQCGREYMDIIREEISNFLHPFYEPVNYGRW
ncbi:hypothetical protein GLOIN_2v1613602 [Rhizophagus clarus]|uniref:F-box domain-containing protein n=1 Tax=Rhizophagus clarus TaxID=94130 RepID=A0A8H3QJI3_9GLOM|nr:hypothetical protein GLOIN_2v1613602 [Rhizophagus clarus]